MSPPMQNATDGRGIEGYEKIEANYYWFSLVDLFRTREVEIDEGLEENVRIYSGLQS